MTRNPGFHSALLAVAATSALITIGCSPPPPLVPTPTLVVAPSFTLSDTGQSINLDAYRARLAVYSRVGGHTRVRLAATGSCTSACGTVVTFEAYPWTKDVPANGVPQPILVGHLVNNGPYTTQMYSLKPSDLAEYDVYAVPDNSHPNRTAFEITEVPKGPIGIVKTHFKGNYHSCYHNPARSSEADFRPCELPQARAIGDAIVALAMRDDWAGLVARAVDAFARAALWPPEEDPGWLACDGGCCTLLQE